MFKKVECLIYFYKTLCYVQFVQSFYVAIVHLKSKLNNFTQNSQMQRKTS